MPKPNWGGGAAGAASGAYAGSTFGPAGTVIGAVVGGAAGLFGGGRKKKPKKRSRFDPGQQGVYDESMDALRGKGGPFGDLFTFNPEAANQNFDQMYSRPAYRQFSENIVPGITGQYRKGNIMNSSYSGEALGRAGRDVQEGLDAQRANMIYQGTQDTQNRKYDYLKNLLNMQTFDLDPGQENSNPLDTLLSQLAPEAGNWIAEYMKGRGGGSMTPGAAGSANTGGGLIK